MSRYFTRAAKPLYFETPMWGDEHPLLPSLSVSDHKAIETGLVDHRGDPIMRAPNEIGFHSR